jgi:hypothetical protein
LSSTGMLLRFLCFSQENWDADYPVIFLIF